MSRKNVCFVMFTDEVRIRTLFVEGQCLIELVSLAFGSWWLWKIYLMMICGEWAKYPSYCHIDFFLLQGEWDSIWLDVLFFIFWQSIFWLCLFVIISCEIFLVTYIWLSSSSSNHSKCWSWEERLKRNPLWKTWRNVWRWDHI
jgi:hypothetical protein